MYDNFGKTAQFGIDTKFTWLKDKKITPAELALTELIPLKSMVWSSRVNDAI